MAANTLWGVLAGLSGAAQGASAGFDAYTRNRQVDERLAMDRMAAGRNEENQRFMRNLTLGQTNMAAAKDYGEGAMVEPETGRVRPGFSLGDAIREAGWTSQSVRPDAAAGLGYSESKNLPTQLPMETRPMSLGDVLADAAKTQQLTQNPRLGGIAQDRIRHAADIQARTAEAKRKQAEDLALRREKIAADTDLGQERLSAQRRHDDLLAGQSRERMDLQKFLALISGGLRASGAGRPERSTGVMFPGISGAGVAGAVGNPGTSPPPPPSGEDADSVARANAELRRRGLIQ